MSTALKMEVGLDLVIENEKRESSERFSKIFEKHGETPKPEELNPMERFLAGEIPAYLYSSCRQRY